VVLYFTVLPYNVRANKDRDVVKRVECGWEISSYQISVTEFFKKNNSRETSVYYYYYYYYYYYHYHYHYSLQMVLYPVAVALQYTRNTK
jgi:hypothetical protein